jgi:hypothetical protein
MNAPAGPGPQDDKDVVTKTTDTVYESLMKSIIRVIKEMPKTWKQLKEGEQDMVIAKLDYDVKEATRNAVLLIAADGRPNIVVELEQVVFKDGVKATVKMGKAGEARHELADAVGGSVILVIADAQPYTKGKRPEAEPEQQGLNLDGLQKQADEHTRQLEEEEQAKRDEAGCHIALADAGFDITAEEIAGWTLEQITEARACADALQNQEDGEEITLPPHLIGRLKPK